MKQKIERHTADGNEVEILNAEWSREHIEEAAHGHANVITNVYGETYALPNKFPKNNAADIEKGVLDVYLLRVNGEYAGTACLSSSNGEEAELGRSASTGRVGNSIIQDLRILEWLLLDEQAQRYSSLFTTLRTAPDRDIGSDMAMRGGEAVHARWRKLPRVIFNGVSPMYLKHGALEQFTHARINRDAVRTSEQLFVHDPLDSSFITEWMLRNNTNFKFAQGESDDQDEHPTVSIHAPPTESSIYPLVHADVHPDPNSDIELKTAVKKLEKTASPFIHVLLPIDRDTKSAQAQLRDLGFTAFGFDPGSGKREPLLQFGRVRNGVQTVPTYWSANGEVHPFWDGQLAEIAKNIEGVWTRDD